MTSHDPRRERTAPGVRANRGGGLRRFAWLLVGVIAAAVGQAQSNPAAPSEVPVFADLVPSVETAGLEPAIANQLAGMRAAVAEQYRSLAEASQRSSEQLSRTAAGFYELGRHYHAYELYAAAAGCYQASLQIAPEPVTAYLLAMARRELGELESALLLLEQLAERQPQAPAPHYYAALTLFDLGRFEDAGVALLGASEDVVRGSAAFQVLLGRLALERAENERAAMHFERAIELAPEASRTYYLLAQAHRALGDRAAASRALAQYGDVGAKPADPLLDGVAALRVGSAPYTLAGRRAFAAGRYQEAAEAFRKAAAASPDDVSILVNLASALGQSGAQQEAAEILEQVLQRDPESQVARFNLGVVLEGLGAQPQRALKLLASAIDAAPDDLEARSQWARALARRGRTDAALAAIEPARNDPRLTESLRLLEVNLLLANENWTAAAQRLDAGLEALPTSGRLARAGARFWARVPSLEHRNGEKALDLARRVFDATADPADAVAVAWAHAARGACEDVVFWLERAQREAGGEHRLGSEETALLRAAAHGECGP